MGINTNLADAPAWGESVPDGQYLAEVVTAEQTVSGSSGNDMIVLSLGVIGGEHGGRTLPKDYLVFSKGGLSRIAYTLKALGIAIPQGSFNLEAQSLVGRKALVTVKTIHEKAKDGYDARDVLKITAYDAAPGSANDTAVEAALGAVTPSAATLGDDDIPF